MGYESDALFFVYEHQPNICIIHHHQSQRWIRIIANVIQEYALINLCFIGSFFERMDVGNPPKIGRLHSYIHKYCIIHKVILRVLISQNYIFSKALETMIKYAGKIVALNVFK